MSRRFVTIEGRTIDSIGELVSKHHVEVIRHTLKMLDDRLTVDALIEPDMFAALRAAGYKVEPREEAEEDPRARAANLVPGRRYYQ